MFDLYNNNTPECCAGLFELDTVAVDKPIEDVTCCAVLCGTPTPGGGCKGCELLFSLL
jgi:hypothetical protein